MGTNYPSILLMTNLYRKSQSIINHVSFIHKIEHQTLLKEFEPNITQTNIMLINKFILKEK